MVRIIDGEIVQDDDPRLKPQHQSQPLSGARGPHVAPVNLGQARRTATAAGTGGFTTGFDWSAPPLKVVPNANGPGGLPDFEVFGLGVPGMGMVALAAAGIFFGWRGLLAAGVLGYLYLRTGGGGNTQRGGQAAATAGSGSQSGSMTQQFWQGAADETSFQAGQQAPNRQIGSQSGSGSQGSSAFKGRSYKLGSN